MNEFVNLLLLLLHQVSLRAHFQVSININKYIIESEARTVRRLTKATLKKCVLSLFRKMSYEGDDVMSDGRLFQITGAQRLKAREPMTVGREVTDGVASLLNAADLSGRAGV